IDVVVGNSNPHKAEIEELCKNYNYNFHCQVDNMAQLMAKADLAIGAGGTSTWERISLGLPSITYSIADNQNELVKYAKDKKLLIECKKDEDLSSVIKSLMANSDLYRLISENCLQCFVGEETYHIFNMIFISFRKIRKDNEKDKNLIFNWRNNDNVRLYSFNQKLISKEEHEKWFSEIDKNYIYFICEYNKAPVGALYFNNIQNNEVKWGFYLGERNVAKKLGYDMCFYGLNYAFCKLKFKKITAEILTNNIKSIKLHESLGFTKIKEEKNYLIYECHSRL